MTPFQKYLAYIRDNPDRLWFRRKLYGWGWTPATWQGWLSLAVFLLAFLSIFLPFVRLTEPTSEDIIWFCMRVALLVAALLAVCYLKGESPKWQWGLPKDNAN